MGPEKPNIEKTMSNLKATVKSCCGPEWRRQAVNTCWCDWNALYTYTEHDLLLDDGENWRGEKHERDRKMQFQPTLLIAGRKRQIVSSHIPKVAEMMVGIILTRSKPLHFNLFLDYVKYLEREKLLKLVLDQFLVTHREPKAPPNRGNVSTETRLL